MIRCINLHESLSEETISLGNKARNLSKLANIDFNTPKGFGVLKEISLEHIAPLKDSLIEITKNSNDYKEISEKIKKIVVNHDFSNSIKFELEDAINKFTPNVDFFAVRSSGMPQVKDKVLVEDSQNTSLAGQFKTYLKVPKNKVVEAIKFCISELFNERSLKMFDVKRDFGYFDSGMSLVIQEMIEADLSAVIMTIDPIEKNNLFGIESIFGACEGIVNGHIQGDIYLLDRDNGNVVYKELGKKHSYYKYKELNNLNEDNYEICKNIDEKIDVFTLNQDMIRKIFDICMKIENFFQKPQDIELVIKDDRIVLTQARPITVL